ncbi:MAG TPA: A/G-specific adenine glycosylase [Steroidobacteraceae bacterium]|nr:A/G-specific adenine glycosylase [Steroidobacteraceae bacterium]
MSARQPLAPRLLEWHARAGRHDLPWQQQRTPYRVWVSEIMLQQTQVSTVIPYFERFMRRFPEVRALADAPLDDVLHLWTGLGYYARARNLHRAAQVIRDQHAGRFPEEFDAVMDLPGIGRSTAGAILAQSRGARHAILDGNVRRVLSRHYAIDGAPNDAATLAELWRRADENTPTADLANYTQAIMDLGATLCTRKPCCEQCPVAADCRARLESRQGELPAPKRRRAARRLRRAVMLVARHDSRVLLMQRPPSGIWGGLWCLPEFADAAAARLFAARRLGLADPDGTALPDIEHSFTHFDLVITPVLVRCADAARVGEGAELWYDLEQPARVGLPAPIRTLLGNLSEGSVES